MADLLTKDSYVRSGTGRLSINLTALECNYLKISKITGSSEIAAVLKANAYGLGIAPVVKTLIKQGCTSFFVATFEEALEVRSIHKDCDVYALNGLWTGPTEEFIHHRVIPVLNNLKDIEVWRERAKQQEQILPAALHVNTGMNRLGMPSYEFDSLIQENLAQLEGIDLKILMSHFSSADEDVSENQRQFEKFKDIKRNLSGVRASLANSVGVFRDKEYHFDLVRPGMALYGLNPTPEKVNPMEAVVQLDVPVLQTHLAKKEETVGYNCTYKFDQDVQVATVCLGYADGFLRSLSNQGALYWKGQKCRIIGRVSMDLVTVSLEGIKGKLPSAGDLLEVIGPSQSADDLASQAGTIGYEILTSLGQRYQRVYV